MLVDWEYTCNEAHKCVEALRPALSRVGLTCSKVSFLESSWCLVSDQSA